MSLRSRNILAKTLAAEAAAAASAEVNADKPEAEEERSKKKAPVKSKKSKINHKSNDKNLNEMLLSVPAGKLCILFLLIEI